MPQMKETRRSTRRSATDHRALVLESVATSPRATLDAIRADCTAALPSFTEKKVDAMVWWLRRVGLINRGEDGVHVLTKTGLEWLTSGRFDRALPEYAERPGARKPRGKKGG